MAAPPVRPLPVVSGRPRTPAHRAAEQNAGLVLTVIAARFPSVWRDPDRLADAYAAGYLALVRAAEAYDPSRGCAFGTLAGRCIRRAVLNSLLGERRQRRLPTVALDLPLGEDGGRLEDVIADPQAVDPQAALDAGAGFEARLAGLTGRERAVIRARFAQERAGPEVAAEMGVSRARCHQIERQALARLAAPGGTRQK